MALLSIIFSICSIIKISFSEVIIAIFNCAGLVLLELVKLKKGEVRVSFQFFDKTMVNGVQISSG
jgi:hypothetical protein